MSITCKPSRQQKQRMGLLIYTRRKQASLSQELLAELVGCSPRWIQKIEGGEANPNWIALTRIMCILQISAQELAEEAGILVPVSTL